MSYPFRQAEWHKVRAPGRKIDLLVLHSMESPEKGTTAEDVARYFMHPPRAGSAHYCVDNNSIVQCVQEKDEAAGAKGANHNGIHIEHAGYARQSDAEWRDPFSWNMLHLSAVLAAEICHRHNIPIRWQVAAELKAGGRGITSHDECSKAFGGTHWDPGPHFPIHDYLEMIRAIRHGS